MVLVIGGYAAVGSFHRQVVLSVLLLVVCQTSQGMPKVSNRVILILNNNKIDAKGWNT